MPKFTHLHVHSHYSLLDGLPKIDELLDYVKQLGMDSVVLTDHGNIYGAVEFYKKAKEKGIKPIIGCEMYLAYEGMHQTRPNIDDKRYHLILLVKNEEGYKNLVKLITKAHLEGFYYKPRIDEELLARHSSGLIGLSACLQGRIPRLVLSNKIEEAEKLAQKYEDIFGKGNFYLELQHHQNLPEQKTVNLGIINISKKLGIPLVATNDIHYLRTEDADAQDVLMLINTGADSNDPERLTFKTDDFSMKSPEKMMEEFKDFPEAIENTQKIADSCNFQFELGKVKLPTFEVPSGKTPNDYLEELCREGLKKRFGENIDKTIVERLNYELSVIKQTSFASYFLIVQDFVNWAKSKRIVVGPGRGSAGGSLVAYLLNITNVDPIKYNLLFERFLNPGRGASLPDIDLDFADRRRDEVINYVAEKYGRDRVAQIITFGTMASRAVVRDVGRALKYSYSFCDQIAKLIPFGLTLDQAIKGVSEFRQLYESDQQARTLIDFAKKLEGVARHASTHACGVVISDTALDEIVPLQHPTQDEKTIVTQYEMHSIEDLGLLKMDFLGLKNLTIIEDTLARIYVVQGISLDIEKIPENDKETFKIFQKGDCIGVFQLECLSGDTIISNTTIKKLCEKKDKKRLSSVYLDEGKVHLNQIVNVLEGDEKQLYTLVTENNWFIKASKDHYFLTDDGWKKLKNIKIGDNVLIRAKSKHLVYSACQTCGKQINGQKEGKSKFCYRCSALFYRNPSKKESREKIRTAKIKFYQQGGKPWNFGATTENNEIWKKTAEKISKALQGRSFEELYGPERAREIKIKLSQRSKGKNNPMFGKPCPHRKGGFRKDLGHYVRSTWEADFARILRFHNLNYKYEPETFRLVKGNGEIVHYTPDFYVEVKNTFYEIKGWLHDLDKEKMQLFQEQYPQHNLVMISATKFAEFSLQYKTLINWECPRIPTKQNFKFIRVKAIKYSGIEKTYDIAMQSPGNNFVANGFLVHNSGGMRNYLKQLKPTEFEDIIAMVSLYRPGPMQLIPDYIARKHKKQFVEYLHPKLKPILENTYGICIYQEQIMKLVQDLAGFTLAEADVLRKAIGKKIKKLLMAQKEKFIEGCKKNAIREDVAQQIWYWIEPFASYSFNRSHATAYATIAYQTAYLKAHFPTEFMASLLTSERNDIERIGFLIEECRRMKLEVLPPDINESFAFFSVVPKKNQIRFGLSAIKNVGLNIVEVIVEERKLNGHYVSIQDFISRISSKDLNKKSLESLVRAGVFDKMVERNLLLFNMERLLETSRETQKLKLNGQTGLFDASGFNNQINLLATTAASKKERLAWEKELLGLYVSSHPLEDYRDILEKKVTSLADIQKSSSRMRQTVKVGGIISSIKKIITRTGKPMLFVNLEDLSDKIEVVVFPGVLERNFSVFQENKVVMISGKMDSRDGVPKLICETVEEILEET
ncbi:MAG: DNA polymerase III subunit alpha [bacterium]|nr:DNA polymerase III subunit alpha [bacterium]